VGTVLAGILFLNEPATFPRIFFLLLAVAAVPAALLMPLTFIRIQRTVGTLLYLVLYFVCIANILQ
jgi:hypothetical protein